MDAMPFRVPAATARTQVLLSGSGSLDAQLRDEIEAMLRHAFSTGLDVPPPLMEAVEKIDLCDALPMQDRSDGVSLPALADLHGQLVKVVAPAMPGTLHLLRTDLAHAGFLHAMLGPLANIRRLMIGALVCMVIFILMSLSPTVNHEAMAKDIYSMHGLTLLTMLCFLLSAAGLGSTFHALFMAQSYVSNATYDPRYDASYWIRIGLGLMAGLLLAVLLPVGSGPSAPTMAKPVMALLGGFSAGLVHRILERLVETAESLFQGSSSRKD